MGRIISVGMAALAFYIAYGMTKKMQPWTGSDHNYGHGGAIIIVVGIGILCLLAPMMFKAVVRRLDGNRARGNIAALGDETTNDWRDGENFIPSMTAIVGMFLISLACLTPIAYCWDWFADGSRGPQPIANRDLAQIRSLETAPMRYIKVTPDKVFDPNIVLVNKKGKLNIEKAKFYLVQVDRKFLIARCPINELKNFSGYLMPFSGNYWYPAETDIERRMKKEYPQVEKDILPFELACGADGNVLHWFWVISGISGFFSVMGGIIAGSTLVSRRAKLAARVPAFGNPLGNRDSGTGSREPERESSELGHFVSAHGSKGTIAATIGWTIFGLLLVTGSAAMAWEFTRDGAELGGEPIPQALLWLPGMGGMFSLGAFLLAYASKRPAVTATLYSNGLNVQQHGDSTAFRWDDVADVTETHGMLNRYFIFDLHDGRQVKFGDHVSNCDRFRTNFYGQYGVPDLVLQRLSRIDAGESVAIGDFTVNAHGFTCGSKTIQWHEVASAVFNIYPRHHQKFLSVELRGKFFTWKSPNLFHMKSSAVLCEVIARVAPAHVWPKR